MFNENILFSFTGTSNRIVINGSANISPTCTLAVAGGTIFNINTNGVLTLDTGSQLDLNYLSTLIINGRLIVNSNSILNLNRNNGQKFHYNYGVLKLNTGSVLNINLQSKFFSNGKFYIDEGAIVNQNNSGFSALAILGGVFKSIGNLNNRVTLNFPSQPFANQLTCINADTLILDYTTIDSGLIIFSVSDGLQKPREFLIENSEIINSSLYNYFSVSNTENINITIQDNYFSINGLNSDGVLLAGFNDVQFLRNIVQYNGEYGSDGIQVYKNISTNIKDSEIRGFTTGISQFRVVDEEFQSSNSEDIKIEHCIIEGVDNYQGTGISIGYTASITTGVKIDLNEISNFSSGITVNNDDDFALQIKNNSITNYGSFGISVSNGSEAVIKENIISVN